MPLSTEGLIEGIRRFRSDKLALVALIGTMGAESEADALERLRDVIRVTREQITEIRKMPRAQRRKLHAAEGLWHDVYELATEVEPWLAQLVKRTAA
jgi:hypothetical protein